MRPIIKSTCMIFTYLLLFISFASAENIFGPEIYYRTKGGPNIYTDHFEASAGEAMVSVLNGDPDGGFRVSSASVYLNENLLVKPENFKQGTHVVFEEVVSLAAANDIRVELRGAPESFVTIDIFRPGLSVNINCIPDSIYAGQEAVLSWTSSHAESVYIDNGIGYADLTGSLTVSPETTTTYTVTATGPGGTASDSVTVTVASISLGISITSPENNDMISGPAIMVQGAIANPFGNEVGVMINGIAALVHGNQFVANHVPLDQGENIITAMATDTEGNTAETSVLIDAAISENCIGIAINPQLGVAPFEATLMVDGTFPVIDPYVWGEGPGTVEISDGPGDNQFNIRLTTPGIYFLTAEATDAQGHVYTGSVAVWVLSQAELDALLQRKWNEMKSALADGDVDKAVNYFSNTSRTMYHQRFTDLSSVLDQVAGDMGPIAFVEAAGNMAVYDLITVRDDDIYSYQLIFMREEDGIWRIYNF